MDKDLVTETPFELFDKAESDEISEKGIFFPADTENAR